MRLLTCVLLVTILVGTQAIYLGPLGSVREAELDATETRDPKGNDDKHAPDDDVDDEYVDEDYVDYDDDDDSEDDDDGDEKGAVLPTRLEVNDSGDRGLSAVRSHLGASLGRPLPIRRPAIASPGPSSDRYGGHAALGHEEVVGVGEVGDVETLADSRHGIFGGSNRASEKKASWQLRSMRRENSKSPFEEASSDIRDGGIGRSSGPRGAKSLRSPTPRETNGGEKEYFETGPTGLDLGQLIAQAAPQVMTALKQLMSGSSTLNPGNGVGLSEILQRAMKGLLSPSVESGAPPLMSRMSSQCPSFFDCYCNNTNSSLSQGRSTAQDAVSQAAGQVAGHVAGQIAGQSAGAPFGTGSKWPLKGDNSFAPNGGAQRTPVADHQLSCMCIPRRADAESACNRKERRQKGKKRSKGYRHRPGRKGQGHGHRNRNATIGSGSGSGRGSGRGSGSGRKRGNGNGSGRGQRSRRGRKFQKGH